MQKSAHHPASVYLPLEIIVQQFAYAFKAEIRDFTIGHRINIRATCYLSKQLVKIADMIYCFFSLLLFAVHKKLITAELMVIDVFISQILSQPLQSAPFIINQF